MPSAEARYTRAVRAAHAAALEGGQWPTALEALADYVGGVGAMMVCHDFARREHWQIVGGLDPDVSRLYLHRYGDNVFAREVMRRGPGLYAAHEIADLASHRRTAFMADIWAPQRIENLVQMAHPAMTTQGSSGGFAVALTERGTVEMALVQRRWKQIAPQLRMAAYLYLARSERQRPTLEQARFLALLSDAAFLISDGGHILAANREGESLLGVGEGLRAGQGNTLSAGDERDGRRLKAALAVAALGTSASTAFRLEEPDRLLIIVSPAPEINPTERLTGPGRALVRAIDVRASHSERAATASKLFGLSPAETLVLAHSGRGRSAPAIARALDLSVSTIRTHLTHVFDKIGVRSQAELAQLVARLPSA